MQNIYVLRLWRSDEWPNEEYYYLNIEEALEHFKTYQHGSNDTYFAIELTEQGECSYSKSTYDIRLISHRKKDNS